MWTHDLTEEPPGLLIRIVGLHNPSPGLGWTRNHCGNHRSSIGWRHCKPLTLKSKRHKPPMHLALDGKGCPFTDSKRVAQPQLQRASSLQILETLKWLNRNADLRHALTAGDNVDEGHAETRMIGCQAPPNILRTKHKQSSTLTHRAILARLPPAALNRITHISDFRCFTADSAVP